MPDSQAPLSRPLLYLMAVGCGVSVANNYYNQPLLPEMARSLQESEAAVGYLPALTQAGYTLGLLLFVPLGDRLERRRLTVVMLGTTVLALVAVGLSTAFLPLALANFAVGLTGIGPQLLVPFAAHLAPPAERGRVIGTVMGGLLIGVLLSRTLSGFVGQNLGWPAVYFLAAAVTVLLLLALGASLPRSQPASELPYFRLLGSLVELLREEPILRQSCIFGGATFGAFSAFWATLAFFLAGPPYHYDTQVIGLFSLIGIAGVLAASLAGRLGDRYDARWTIGAGLAVTILAFVVLWLGGERLWALVAGVILMDAGVQATHIANQTRVYALRPEARNRLNTVYMVSYFIGGVLGSSLAAFGWTEAGWPGVCLAGGLLPLAALVVFAQTIVSQPRRAALDQPPAEVDRLGR